MGKYGPIEEGGIGHVPRSKQKSGMRLGVRQWPAPRVRQSMKNLTTWEILHSVDMAIACAMSMIIETGPRICAE
jgi:hypothetical protein